MTTRNTAVPRKTWPMPARCAGARHPTAYRQLSRPSTGTACSRIFSPSTVRDAPQPRMSCATGEIKFKAFLDYALHLGADKIATGHYAGVRCVDDVWQLVRAHDDENKDQTYFLHMLGQRIAPHPVSADRHRQTGRARTRDRRRLPHHEKRTAPGSVLSVSADSVTFCPATFPPIPATSEQPRGSGSAATRTDVLHTGQRQGLGIGGISDAPDEPWYVVGRIRPTMC